MDAMDNSQEATEIKENMWNFINYEIYRVDSKIMRFADELSRKHTNKYTLECQLLVKSFHDNWLTSKDVIATLWNYTANETEMEGHFGRDHMKGIEENKENVFPAGAVLPLEDYVPLELPSEPREAGERKRYFLKHWVMLLNKIHVLISPYFDDDQEYREFISEYCGTQVKKILSNWKRYSLLIYLIWKHVVISDMLVLNLSQKAIYWKGAIHVCKPDIPKEVSFDQTPRHVEREDTSLKAKDTTQTDDSIFHSGASGASTSHKGDDQLHEITDDLGYVTIAEISERQDMQAKERLSILETELSKLKTEKENLEENIKPERDKVYKLECQLKSAQQKCNELKAKIDENNKTWKNINDNGTVYESQERQLTKQLADKETEIHGLQGGNQLLLAQCENLSKQLQEQEARYKTKNDDLIQTQRKLEESVRELENANKTLLQQSAAMHLQFEKEHENSARLLRQNKELDDRTKAHEKELEKLKEEKQQYIQRLSEKMSQQLARDETALENISVETSPLKLKEEYVAICCGQWLEAKSTLDENAERLTENNTEEDFCNLLVDIISVCHVFVKDLHQAIIQVFEECMAFPTHPHVLEKMQPAFPEGIFLKENTGNPSILKTVSKQTHSQFDEDFKVKLCYYLKRRSSYVDWSDLSTELLKSQLKKHFPEQEHEFFVTDKALREYVTAFLALSWKMVLQQPPMYFNRGIDKTNRQFDSSKHDLAFRSAEPNEPGVCITYVVTPALWHGEKQLTKAKVFLQRSNGPKSHDESVTSSHHQKSSFIAAQGASCKKVEYVVDNENMTSPLRSNDVHEYTEENEQIENDQNKGETNTCVAEPAVETSITQVVDFDQSRPSQQREHAYDDEGKKAASHLQTSPSIAEQGANKVEDVVDNGNMNSPLRSNTVEFEQIGNDPKKGDCVTNTCDVEPAVEATEECGISTTPVANSGQSLEQHDPHDEGDHRRHLAATWSFSLSESCVVINEDTCERNFIKAQTGAHVTKEETVTPDDADNHSMDHLASSFGKLSVAHP